MYLSQKILFKTEFHLVSLHTVVLCGSLCGLVAMETWWNICLGPLWTPHWLMLDAACRANSNSFQTQFMGPTKAFNAVEKMMQNAGTAAVLA